MHHVFIESRTESGWCITIFGPWNTTILSIMSQIYVQSQQRTVPTSASNCIQITKLPVFYEKPFWMLWNCKIWMLEIHTLQENEQLLSTTRLNRKIQESFVSMSILNRKRYSDKLSVNSLVYGFLHQPTGACCKYKTSSYNWEMGDQSSRAILSSHDIGRPLRDRFQT